MARLKMKPADQAKGCGCLALLALLPFGMLASCFADPPEPARVTAPAPTIRATSPYPTYPAYPSYSAAYPTTTPGGIAAGAGAGADVDAPDPTRRRTATSTKRTTSSSSSAHYKNCAAARAAGAAPILAGEPGYRAALDRDRDGVACE